MSKAARTLLATCALIALGGSVAACGGVPGNAVATVDGAAIEKTSFDHWLNVAAKSSGTNAATPDPPSYAKCIAAKKKAAGKNASKTTDATYKKQCSQEYTQLRDTVLQTLISFRWIQGEADAQGVQVTDAEVKKSFATQKKQSFPKDADYKKFLTQSGQSEADILQRVKLDLLSTKIRDKVIKGKDQVSAAQIKAYFDKNQSQFSQPERRDLRVVLTKSESTAQTAKKALQSGDSWKAVAKKYSIDDQSKNAGGLLSAQAKGTLDKQLDAAVFGADKGKLTGPTKTQFGYYVFEVTKVAKAQNQTLAQATATIKQTLSQQAQTKALNAFISDFQKRWRDKTECSDSYKTSDCKNGPDPTPTPSTSGTTGTGTGTGTSGTGTG